jgi:phosphatidylserine/phosphatidylglycerophosphate/cardiolipin synthase-like enzyme
MAVKTSPATKATPKKATKKSTPKRVPHKNGSSQKATSKKVAPKKLARKKTTTSPKPPKNPAPAKGSTTPAGPTNPKGSTTPKVTTPPPFEVMGTGSSLFTLKVYRGEQMALLAMNWANNQKPPDNFVGFAIEYKEPNGTQFFAVKNRLSFLQNDGNVNPNILSSRLSPIQKFRWTHFPFHPDLPGEYTYRVTPVFMDSSGVLSYGDQQEASIQLGSDTYPGEMNIAFTRGFVASQKFVDDFGANGGVGTIIPQKADDGLTFKPTDPKAATAMDWMGFEAREVIIDALNQAVADTTAQVRVTAYDFNEPEVVNKLVQLGNRLRIIIDDSGTHGRANSPESTAAGMLTASGAKVQRQHMGALQHNKTLAINGNNVQLVVGGSTNFSWRGFFVQNNNAVLLYGPQVAKIWFDQFQNLWDNPNKPAGFQPTASAGWNDLGIPGVNGQVSFSPHNGQNARLATIASDIAGTTSSLFYSLAFLYETPGPILNAITTVTNNDSLFVYGLSDKTVGGLDIQRPDGNLPIAFPANLLNNVPEPFKAEATGGSGTRMHHKFVVIDFDKTTTKVYTGSHNFSSSADTKNGENLFLFQDRRIAVSYMIEAVVMFDHYEFRDAIAKSPTQRLFLKKPPTQQGDKPWWDEDYTDPAKARDRELFSKDFNS